MDKSVDDSSPGTTWEIWLYIRISFSLCIYSILFLKMFAYMGNRLSACPCLCPFVSARGDREGSGWVWFDLSVRQLVCIPQDQTDGWKTRRPDGSSPSEMHRGLIRLPAETSVRRPACVTQCRHHPSAGRQTVNQRPRCVNAFASREEIHRCSRRWTETVGKKQLRTICRNAWFQYSFNFYIVLNVTKCRFL